MEGDPEGSDEDLQGPTVLWEKCIQQSIFVDLSENESLHFSDLEASLALHLSQAESAASEASIHLSGSAELSGLDDTSSGSSSGSSQSEKVVENETKSSMRHVSVLRPNNMQDERPLKRGFEDSGQNTSDEDQDDLPYDHDLGSLYFNQTASSEGNTSSDGRETVHASPEGPGLRELPTSDGDIIGGRLVSAEKPAEDSSEHDEPSDATLSCPSPADINQLLLRHFSREELLRPGRLIEAETLPEVSLLESMDDTALSRAPTLKSTTTNNHSKVPACDAEIFSGEESHTALTHSSLGKEAENKIDSVTSLADSIGSSRTQRSGDNSDAGKQESFEEDAEVQRVPPLCTRSFSDLKYGQGQVHYPLPDFSKVAPKVKIPKAPSGPARPAPRSPGTMHRALSSPGMLELVSRVLEDSVQQPEKTFVFKDEERQNPPALVHHLQAEYDKLLTKYAEAENLIDQMRLGTNTQPSAELMLYSECDDHQRNSAEGNHLGSSAPRRPSSENLDQKRGTAPETNVREVNTTASSGPSDGERMTAELRDIISPFMQKVEEFRVGVGNMSMGTAEQQMMLRSMMEAQDQLERKHMSAKDEHRALEMQNYMGLSRNIGTFDPNRLVEGDIFRIGMHLDNIKEMIDKNVREQISPPISSSSPTPVKEKVHVKPRPDSPPPSLHEGPFAGLSTVNFKMETQREEGTAEEDEEEEGEEGASEVHKDDALERSSELITTDSVRENTGYNNCNSWSSPERRDIQRPEDEEGGRDGRSSVLSEGIVHGNISAFLSGTRSTSRQEEWTPDSHSTPNSVRVPEGECDLGDCVSLSVEVSSSSGEPRDPDTHSNSEPPVDTTCASQVQRIVSPETDSGFGSSYLNQSATGSFQPTLLIESSSAPSHSGGLSGSDSEGSSCSNLQTTVHPASLDVQRWATSHPAVQTQFCGATAAVERWVESTTKEPSVRLQGCDLSLPAQLDHCVSEPVLSSAMESEDRGSQVYSCSCNSEAILALQSEVSRLKRDLQEGLVQLPHLAQKMDYLTSKYRRDGLEVRRSKTRPRTPPRPARNSPARKEDWISLDMDPSKTKGTDSGTALSEVMSQSHSSPAGSRRGCVVRAEPESQYKRQGALLRSNRGTEGNCSVKTSALTSSTSKGGRGGASGSPAEQRPRMAIMESFCSRERWSPLSSPSPQKPLLQVSYGSSCSLPASYKVRELQPSEPPHRKRSTQSDSALLPSNVYFQRTPLPISVPSKAHSRRGRRRGTKEEEMSKTLDQAIEVARSMKRTTDRMAKRLSADLAKGQLDRRLHSTQPLGGRTHPAL